MVGLHQILAGNVITSLEALLNCQCHFKLLCQIQWLYLYLKEILLVGLDLTVTEINIKKKYKNKT